MRKRSHKQTISAFEFWDDACALEIGTCSRADVGGSAARNAGTLKYVAVRVASSHRRRRRFTTEQAATVPVDQPITHMRVRRLAWVTPPSVNPALVDERPVAVT